MSLINKVLLDLDNRTQGGAITANQSLFSNLNPVGVPSPGSLLRWAWTFIAILILFGGVAGGWYYMNRVRVAQIEPVAKRTVSSPEMVAKVAVPEKHVSEPPAASTPSAVAAKPAPVVSESKPDESTHVPPNRSVAPRQSTPPVASSAASKPDHAASASSADKAVAPAEDSSLKRTLRPLSSEEKAESLYRKGVSLIRSGQEREGENALQTALAINPAHIEARETLSVVLLQEHDFEQAKRILSEGINIAPGYAPFSSRLARLYVEQGDESRALHLLEHNLAQVTPDATYLGMLGTLYQRASKPAEARDAFRQAINLQPDEGRWWMGLGVSLETLRDWAAARDAYQRCLGTAQTGSRIRQYAEQRLSIVSQHIH